jgi:hypothetical protein
VGPKASPLAQVVLGLYLATVALLPWSWFPPFPWLHHNAQWSDALFAATALLWIVERAKTGQWPRLRLFHAAIGLYLLGAALSLLFATPPPHRLTGAAKLLGIAELCVLALITSDLAARPRVMPMIARVVAGTMVAVALAAVAGLALFYAGIMTSFVGIYGDLEPSRWYARVQAGTIHPHMLGSFCIFAGAVLARADADLPPLLGRAARIALWVTIFLTFSRAILGFLAAAAVRALGSPRWRVPALAAITACVALLVVWSLWKFIPDPAHPLQSRLDTSTPSRHWYTAVTTLETVRESPWWGSGLGTSPGDYLGSPFDAHLTPLNIAGTLGVPALLAFGLIVVALWRERRRPVDLATWSGLAGLAVDGLASDVEDFRHLWVLFGLADAGREEAANVKREV